MRSTGLSFLFTSLLGLSLMSACSGGGETSASGGESTSSGTDSDTSSSSSASTSTTSSSTTTTSTSGGTGNACVPGMSVGCACPDGGMGAQVCKADGSGFDPCECVGTSATTSTSAGTTDPTGTGTTTDLTTTGDPTTTTTGGMACSDPGPEPNEVEQDAVDLGEQPCMDMAQTFTGVLDGDADVDWFVFHGDWQQCGQAQTDPRVSNVLTASDMVRLCVFVECDQGNNQFMCPMGAMQEMSPDGLPGCCGAGSLEFTLNCQGTGDESANVFVRLDQAPANSCVDYSVDASYNPS